MIIVAAPCAHVCVRGPGQNGGGGWPLNSVVRCHLKLRLEHRILATRLVIMVLTSPFFWGAYLLLEQRRVADAAIAAGLGVAAWTFAVVAKKEWLWFVWGIGDWDKGK